MARPSVRRPLIAWLNQLPPVERVFTSDEVVNDLSDLNPGSVCEALNVIAREGIYPGLVKLSRGTYRVHTRQSPPAVEVTPPPTRLEPKRVTPGKAGRPPIAPRTMRDASSDYPFSRGDVIMLEFVGIMEKGPMWVDTESSHLYIVRNA